MAEYIDKDQALMQLTGRFPHSMSLEKYIGLVNFRLNGLDAADVVGRKRVDDAIKEMERYSTSFEYANRHDLAGVVDNCIAIIQTKIGGANE